MFDDSYFSKTTYSNITIQREYLQKRKEINDELKTTRGKHQMLEDPEEFDEDDYDERD
jgi:hypothetical protein